MLKKSIAAALLVVMLVWAEMAMAPMFLMQAGHVHAALQMPEHQAVHHHHAMPAGLPCCPGLHGVESTAPIEIAAGGLPCQDEHECCFRQGPQNIPAPVSAGRSFSREMSPAQIAELRPALSESRVSPLSVAAPGSPPGLFGMVLRI
jgi:hypothetical protein